MHLADLRHAAASPYGSTRVSGSLRLRLLLLHQYNARRSKRTQLLRVQRGSTFQVPLANTDPSAMLRCQRTSRGADLQSPCGKIHRTFSTSHSLISTPVMSKILQIFPDRYHDQDKLIALCESRYGPDGYSLTVCQASYQLILIDIRRSSNSTNGISKPLII
jgi:hypothetical protein